MRQTLIALELHPYIVNGVTYGNGRFERAKFQMPDFSTLRLEPQKPYSSFLQNLIDKHKTHPKDLVTGKFIRRKPDR